MSSLTLTLANTSSCCTLRMLSCEIFPKLTCWEGSTEDARFDKLKLNIFSSFCETSNFKVNFFIAAYFFFFFLLNCVAVASK